LKKFSVFIFVLLASRAFAAGPVTPAAPDTAFIFPALSAQSLTDTVVSLPEAVTGKVSLMVLTFSRPDDKDLASWVKPFAEKFNGNSMTAYYEIALIGDVGFINGIIFGGMKDGATDEQKAHLLVYFHDKDPYKKIFNVTDDSLIYICLLDQKGMIRLARSGRHASPADMEEILNIAGHLINNP
jgi:hypothetical protein